MKNLDELQKNDNNLGLMISICTINENKKIKQFILFYFSQRFIYQAVASIHISETF